MKKTRKIRNLDALESEIFRLRLEAKNIEEKMDKNLDHLQENYFSMAMNSLFDKKENNSNRKNGFWRSWSNNEKFEKAMSDIAGNIATKAAESLNDLVNKILSKKKD